MTALLEDSHSTEQGFASRFRLRAATLLGWALLVLFALRAMQLGRIGADVTAFQLAYCVGFGGYLILLWVVLRRDTTTVIGPWWSWLTGCALLHLILLWTLPSDDAYRYLWEGRVQLDGFNPYALAPSAPELEGLRTETWSKINHPDYPAIYGPVAEFEFLVASAMYSCVHTPKGLHALWNVLTIAVVGAVLRRLGHRPHRAIVFGLCPLVLTAFAIEGHVDSLMLLLVALSVWAAVADRLSLAGAMLGLALATKIIAIVLLPWFAVQRPKACLIAIGVAIACYLPYAMTGANVFASLTRFGEGEFFSLLGTFGLTSYESNVSRVVVGAILLAVLVNTAFRNRDFIRYVPASFGALIVLMPIVHYWYAGWVLLFSAIRLRIRWLVFALTAVTYFEAERQLATSGAWTMPTWVPDLVWSCFLSAWVCERILAPRTSRTARVTLKEHQRTHYAE